MSVAQPLLRDGAMTEIVRIGPSPSLLKIEQQALAALRACQAQPNIRNILRAADAWRVYERALNAAFPTREQAR